MEREKDFSKDSTDEEIEKMRILEKSIIEGVDKAYFPSIFEENYIREKWHLNNVSTVPAWAYEKNSIGMHNVFEDSSGLIFVGSSVHAPNFDGLTWFFDKVWPKILQKLPDIPLHLVGFDCAKGQENVMDGNVIFERFLSEQELDALYAKTKISIAPLRYGAGIKGKVVDAVYHQVPVVTTNVGAEGLDTSLNCLAIAQNEDDFVDKIVEIYTNKDQWKKMIENSDTFIERYFSMAALKKVFEKDI